MKSRPLALFSILAYALSWRASIPLALDAQGVLFSIPRWLYFIGAFGPLLAALKVRVSQHSSSDVGIVP